MTRRWIPSLVTILALAWFANLAGQAQPTQSEEFAKRDTWRKSMKQTPVPHKGCFNATYPSAEWQEVTCTDAPDDPLPQISPAGSAHADTAGGGVDNIAYATSGLLSSAEGAFLTVSGLTSESSYSMQLNSNDFSSSASSCNGASACQGWQQFVFQSSGSVYMQYWLFNLASCPGGWITYKATAKTRGGCYKNSSSTSVPGYVISNSFPYITVTGKAAGGTDTVIVGTVDGNLSAVGQDSVLNLELGWSAAEFNIVGNSNADQVNFNSGTTFVVQTSINNGTTNAPYCGSGGYTAETNNLNLVAPCCPYGGTSPSIQFMESNASGAKATCGASGLQGNFAAPPNVTDVNVTVTGGPPFYINYSGILEDSTPGATIYYQPTVCGNIQGVQDGSAPVDLDFEVEGCSGVSGPMWATAPGYIPSPINYFNL